MDKVALAELRKSYERDELDEASCADDPLHQFEKWLEQAIKAQLPEPNAMTLATVGADGRPSTRIVLIKGLDARGLVWYTNYDSRKGRELAHQPHAALQFHWVELERVVRVEGRVEKVSAEESDAYYATRPLDSRIGAWASPQSQPITLARSAGGQRRQGRRATRPAPAATPALGRLSAGSRSLGVLAGPSQPPARPRALQPGVRTLDAPAPGALKPIRPCATAMRRSCETSRPWGPPRTRSSPGSDCARNSAGDRPRQANSCRAISAP